MRRIFILLLLLIGTASAVPLLPAEFWGSVTIDGAPAPAGTVIIARIDGRDCGSLTLDVAGVYGGDAIFDKRLLVSGEADDKEREITFFVNDVKAVETAIYTPGTSKRLDLSITARADFSADVTCGVAPLTVQFTDQSTNDPTSWDWFFGDGTTSTEQNPAHTYESAGTYTVTLTATNDGGSDTETRTDYITVTPPPPAADFTADPAGGNAPLTVQFTDESTGNVTSWLWDFGDGKTSTVQNPAHTYKSAGTYAVTLNASNAYGEDTKTRTDYVTVLKPPAADFTADPTGGNAPLTVQFTDESTGNTETWLWTFGDGGTSTAQNPMHTYKTPGNYTVNLSVEGEICTKSGYIKVIPVLFGDANDDNVVDQADTLLVLKQVVGAVEPGTIPEPGTEKFRKIDVNQNGVIDVGDALFIAQYNVGLRDVWLELL